LKVGDRVRVKAGTRVSKYPAGDKGTVAEGLHQFGARRHNYFVAMDKDASPQHPVALFNEEEIEPDV
jgi:hypothetical protein